MIAAKRNPAASDHVRIRAVGRFVRLMRGHGEDMRSPGTQNPEIPPPHPLEAGALDQRLHDLRTPLGTIFGISEILSLTASTPQERTIAETLKSSSEELRRQIDALFEALQPEETAGRKN